jgi:hypothetical protein
MTTILFTITTEEDGTLSVEWQGHGENATEKEKQAALLIPGAVKDAVKSINQQKEPEPTLGTRSEGLN